MRLRLLLLLTVCTLLLAGAAGTQLRLNVFLSFEDEEEISSLQTTGGVQLAQSTRFPTWRTNSLEAVFPPAGGVIEMT